MHIKFESLNLKTLPPNAVIKVANWRDPEEQSTIKKKKTTVKRPQKPEKGTLHKIKHEIKLMFQMVFKILYQFRVFIGAWATSAKTFMVRFNQRGIKIMYKYFSGPPINHTHI